MGLFEEMNKEDCARDQAKAAAAEHLACLAMKILICLISLGIFILIGIVLLIVCMSASGTSAASLSSDALTWYGLAAALACLTVFLTALYAFARFLGALSLAQKYCKLFKVVSFILLLAMFIFCAVGHIALLGTVQIDHPVAIGVLAVCCALISFMPVAATWSINDEARLKNIIDAIAKAFSCLAVISGAIAVVLKLFMEL